MRLRTRIIPISMAVLLAACGGGVATDGNAPEPQGALSDVTSAPSDGSSGNGSASRAEAILVVGDETYTWQGDETSMCTIGGVFPVSVEFQTEEVKADGDWFQFKDRGDGGINFSAFLDGEEYSGTGSGEADEITSSGFSYSGRLNRGGESLDATLEVRC